MDIIEEAKKAATLKAQAEAAATKAANHAAWTLRCNQCIAWFKTNLGITVEPYDKDYHGLLCRSDEGLHFAWREDDRRLAGSPSYGKFTGGPAASLLYRQKPYWVKTGVGRVPEGTKGARKIHSVYQLSAKWSSNGHTVFYDLAGLGASLQQAEENGVEIIWTDD